MFIILCQKIIKHNNEICIIWFTVGSFVWSHLNNLLTSSMPSRVEIQGLLQNNDLGKKFSSDVRKFSHNFEGSVFLDEYNVGKFCIISQTMQQYE